MIKRVSHKKSAILVGIFILVAYGVLVSGVTTSRLLVMIADVISGFAVIGIAVIMFPFFKVVNKKLSSGYLALKLLEGGFMVFGGLVFLSGPFQYLRSWVYDGIHLYVFIVSGLIFYYLLFKTKIVPRYISIWGLVAISVLLVKTLLGKVGFSSSILEIMLALIVTNEIFLAIWLMVKGFNLSGIKK